MLMWSCVTVVGVMVWSLSKLALLYVLTDGVLAVMVTSAVALFGLWGVRLILGSRPMPWRWQLTLAAGLGIGLLCLGLLCLGLLGMLTRALWVGLLLSMGLVGLARVVLILRRQAPKRLSSNGDSKDRPTAAFFSTVHILLLGLMPFLALSLLVATVPAGVLWAEEAYGYDVLEYHLQVPKEYYHHGQIQYLPHNIYSNFPMNAEMLYLLAMILKQDPLEASLLAKFFNVLLAALFVVSAWLIGREYHPAAGVIAALLAGSSPWIMYLCGVAYAENGMLAFGLLSAACVCLYERRRYDHTSEWRLALLAGVFAGLSCGFKYTAVPMIAAPLFVVLCGVALRRPTRQHRHEMTKPAQAGGTDLVVGKRCWSHPSWFLLGTVLTVAPWLIKNTTMTGNPVFPLAYHIFGCRAGVWSSQLADQWRTGHNIELPRAALRERLGLFKGRILMDRRFGWWLIVFALPILLSKARSYLDVSWLFVLLSQLVIWLLFTHLFARFAVVALIPLCILGGRSILASGKTWYRTLIIAAASLVVIFNLFSAGSMYAAELVGQRGQTHGRVHWLYEPQPPNESPVSYIRQHFPPGSARVLMVAEARAFYMPTNVDYCVVFSRNPFAEAVARARNDEDIIGWLNEQRYTHLLVHWSEMQRLQNTYGFWKGLTPALFQRLEQVGLAVVKTFRGPHDQPYATLYEVRTLLPDHLMMDTSDRHGPT